MIENVIRLKNKKATNNAKIVAYIGPKGCYQTTTAIEIANHNPKHNILFVSLEMSPIQLSKRITNKNVDISDKMVWDGKILNNYDVIIINNIELLSKNQTIKWLNTAKKLKNDCKINTCMFTHLISNKEDINYWKEHQNSQYIKEIADKVWILKKDDDNDNDILFKIEKSNFEELDDCWYYLYKMENGKLKNCMKIKKLYMEE